MDLATLLCRVPVSAHVSPRDHWGNTSMHHGILWEYIYASQDPVGIHMHGGVYGGEHNISTTRDSWNTSLDGSWNLIVAN